MRLHIVVIWLLAAGSLAASLGFLAVRLTLPSDGAVVAFYGQGWSGDGVEVAPIDQSPDGLRDGDVVLSVVGRSPAEWLAGVLEPGLDRTALGRPSVPYLVERDGRRLTVDVTPRLRDLGPVLAENWSALLLTVVFQAVALLVLVRRPGSSAAAALTIAACGVTGSTLPWLLGLQLGDVAVGWPFLLHLATAGGLFMLLWPAGAIHLPLALTSRATGPGRRALALAYGIPLAAYLAGLVVAGLMAGPGDWLRLLPAAQAAVILPTILIGVLLTIRGYRRADPTIRRQVRWAALGGGWSAVAAGVLLFGPQILSGAPLVPWSLVGLIALPLPLGIAAGIMRYHLFEIDRIISRTISWVLLSAVLATVFAALVVALQAPLGSVTQGQTLAVAASTLGVFALFQPVRRRIQLAVDRRFDRERVDAQRVAEAFAAQVRHEVDLQTLRRSLLHATDQAVRPQRQGAWLRRGTETG